MNTQNSLPTYEVEFIPLERRLREDRRKHSACSYIGTERRQCQGQGRRDSEVAAAKPRRQV
jgi:hypothetical protein